MSDYNQFTNLFSLSKTLRFELKPVGKTLKYIEGLINQDEKRASDYQRAKKIIDNYHKAFIEKALHHCATKIKYNSEGKDNSLEDYVYYYMGEGKNDQSRNVHLKKIQDSLRAEIVKGFNETDGFKDLSGKELFKEHLLNFVDNEEDRRIVEGFNNFTTYFTGFYKNRENIYTAEEKSTAIAYRLINENLPRFLDNYLTISILSESPVADKFSEIYDNYSEYMNVLELVELFNPGYYRETLTQSQIELYNAIIGGRTLEDGTKIQGINEYVNLFNQQNSKKERLPKLKPLYKQILSDRDHLSWLPEKFDSDKSLFEAIEKFYQDIAPILQDNDDLSIVNMFSDFGKYNLNGVFIKNDVAITEISQGIYGDWQVIKNSILEIIKAQNPKKKKETEEKYQERISKAYKSIPSFSIAHINESTKAEQKIEKYLSERVNGPEGLVVKIRNSYEDIKSILKAYPEDKKLIQDSSSIEKIKAFLDSVKNLQLEIKPLLGDGEEVGKDEIFYADFDKIWSIIDSITPLYNKARNYLTQKPYSIEKFKLNFENSTLLNGWDLNKETANTSIILKKGQYYYLGIMNKRFNKEFVDLDEAESSDVYYKMEYKLLPGPNKMLPKVLLSKKGIETYNPSTELLDLYERGTFKKGPDFNINDLHQLIDFYKSSIERHEDWKKFEFKFLPTEEYKDISAFYRDVAEQGYMIRFKAIDADYIDNLVNSGKLYLFQIYNKDFSEYSKGTPNLHTMYWKMLFDEKNLSNVVYKLNGEAEVFYRRKSIDAYPTHVANVPIKNKNGLNEKKESVFSYDLYKDKRFTADKFQFHVPITMNFKANGSDYINDKVNDYIKDAKDLHIIGIDRGERNLLYVSVIDLEGNIVEQYSLNEIISSGKGFATDYHQLLDAKEKERDAARKSWKTIENIKELKEGYLSQVVHKISELMVKYHAIVVLEDLNVGFMRGRQKVEKQVYQKFEKMLIDKLNYLVDKHRPADELGGLLHALQLTGKVESMKTLGKQCGFLFYVPAWNTSKLDPATGFVNLFSSSDLKYESIEKTSAFFDKFDRISYNSVKDLFEFEFDYSRFTSKAEGSREHWTIYSYSDRIVNFRNTEKNSMWDAKVVSLTPEFKKLFSEYDIPLGPDMKSDIVAKKDKGFLEKMLGLFRLILQMRNSMINSEIDYIISPVVARDGKFYDSRECRPELPENADANGAYNIARKGLILVDKIKNAEDTSAIKLGITNKEWLMYAQRQ